MNKPRLRDVWRLTTFPPGFLTIIPPGGPSLLRDELASA